MIFDTHIDGIECQCRVTHYRPHVPARLGGAMEDAEEEIPGEFLFTLTDRTGHPVPDSLYAIITERDMERLQDEYEAHVTAHKHGKEF